MTDEEDAERTAGRAGPAAAGPRATISRLVRDSRVPARAAARALVALLASALLAPALVPGAAPARAADRPDPVPPGTRAPVPGPAPDEAGLGSFRNGIGGPELALLDVAPGLAALVAAVRPRVPLEPVALSSPIVSGLPWRSGAKGGDCLVDLRRRPLDAVHVHAVHKSFAALVAQTGSAWAREAARAAPLLVVTVPLLTTDTKGRFEQCAAGAYDASWRTVGTNLRKAGARVVVVQLGHEANLGSGTHAWGVDTAAEAKGYVACWRHAAARLRAAFPGLTLDWTMAKQTRSRAFKVLDLYPGDDAADVIGVHYYDSNPRKNTQALWDQSYGATDNGGPFGLGTWLEAARTHGKRLSVGEWGVWRQGAETAASADDPVYIYNMYRFFAVNAPSIAYETYFNIEAGDGGHALCPDTPYPKAAAWYKWAWGSRP